MLHVRVAQAGASGRLDADLCYDLPVRPRERASCAPRNHSISNSPRKAQPTMANIKQQKKRIGLAQRQRMQNLRYRSTIKTLFNQLQLSVDTGDRTAAETTHKELVSLLDRAIARGSVHRNTAARRRRAPHACCCRRPRRTRPRRRKAKKKATPVRKPKADAATKKQLPAEQAPRQKAELRSRRPGRVEDSPRPP